MPDRPLIILDMPDEDLRLLLARALERERFRPLDLAAWSGERVDALVADPASVGSAERVDRAHRPTGAPLIYVSCYPPQMHERLLRYTHYLEQPFAPSALVALVRESLTRAGSGNRTHEPSRSGLWLPLPRTSSVGS